MVFYLFIFSFRGSSIVCFCGFCLEGIWGWFFVCVFVFLDRTGFFLFYGV